MCAQKVVRRYNPNQNSYFFRLTGLIACIAAAVSLALIMLHLVSMGISLSAKPVLIAILIDAALVAFPFYLVLSGKNNLSGMLRIGCILLSVLLICLNLFVSSYMTMTMDFLEGQFGGSSGSVEYSVVAQRSAGIELKTNQSVRAGIQRTDACKEDAEQETQKLATASFTEYDNLSELIGATENEALDIAVVQSVMLSAYAEYFPNSYDKLNVLTTFKAGSEETPANAAGVKIDVTKPFAIYVSGSDTSGDIDQTSRSDVNMLVLIDPEHYKMLLINTPRDYYVQLHGTTGYKDKLTHASVYGIEMSEQTLEDLYGLNINYHVRINYDTLVGLVDAMGGIVVNNPVAFSLWGSSYGVGDIYLTGDYALMYARARKGLEHGDYDRGENQQRVIEALVNRITSAEVVTHYAGVIEALSGTFRSNIPPTVISQLFSRQISLGGDWTIERMSAAGSGASRPTYSMGAQELSVQIPDETSLAEIRGAVSNFMNAGTAEAVNPSPQG